MAINGPPRKFFGVTPGPADFDPVNRFVITETEVEEKENQAEYETLIEESAAKRASASVGHTLCGVSAGVGGKLGESHT